MIDKLQGSQCGWSRMSEGKRNRTYDQKAFNRSPYWGHFNNKKNPYVYYLFLKSQYVQI